MRGHFSRWYLAGPRQFRVDLVSVAERVGARTEWECVSTWLHPDSVPEPVEEAEDVIAAQVLIVVAGAEVDRFVSAGELWVEVGMALAAETEIVIITDQLLEVLPVYCAHPGIEVRVRGGRDLADVICEVLDRGGDARDSD